MTHYEFEKHKQELLQKKKLKVSNEGLIYQIRVDENDFQETFFGSSEHEIQKKIWTGNGVVVPDFWKTR